MLDDFIDQRRLEILAELDRRLSLEAPHLPREQLLDNLPEFLDNLYDALHAEPSNASVAQRSINEVATDQGEQRHRVGVSPSLTARSYGFMCEIVSELADRECLDLPARDVRVMNECIDIAIASSLEEYWRQSSAHRDLVAAQRLGFLAHELRNALMIATHAVAALRAGTVAPQSRTAAMLDRSLKTMDSLTRHALDEAKLVSHVPQLEVAPVSELVEDALLLAADHPNVQVVTDPQPGLSVRVDRDLFQSALGNLVRNAIKFTQKGRVVVRATIAGDDVAIEVEDECGGLSSDPEELFKPFVQRHANRSGVGLGLSIAREAVSRFGGHVDARSRPGQGCVFRIRVPRR